MQKNNYLKKGYYLLVSKTFKTGWMNWFIQNVWIKFPTKKLLVHQSNDLNKFLKKFLCHNRDMNVLMSKTAETSKKN